MTHLASIGPEYGILLSPILALLRLFLQINSGNLGGSPMVQPEWQVGAYWYRLPQSNLGSHMGSWVGVNMHYGHMSIWDRPQKTRQ